MLTTNKLEDLSTERLFSQVYLRAERKNTRLIILRSRVLFLPSCLYREREKVEKVYWFRAEFGWRIVFQTTNGLAYLPTTKKKFLMFSLQTKKVDFLFHVFNHGPSLHPNYDEWWHSGKICRPHFRPNYTCKQGCQMVCFRIKIYNFGIFWEALV